MHPSPTPKFWTSRRTSLACLPVFSVAETFGSAWCAPLRAEVWGAGWGGEAVKGGGTGPCPSPAPPPAPPLGVGSMVPRIRPAGLGGGGRATSASSPGRFLQLPRSVGETSCGVGESSNSSFLSEGDRAELGWQEVATEAVPWLGVVGARPTRTLTPPTPGEPLAVVTDGR